MEIIFSPAAIEDLNYWKKTRNTKLMERISLLLLAIKNDPFHGIGKPEPLRHDFAGMWSRCINKEHRIIYEIASGIITIHALKEHY